MSNWIAHFSLDILGERSVSVHQYPPRTARISRRIRWGDDSKDVVSRAWRKLKGDWVALHELIFLWPSLALLAFCGVAAAIAQTIFIGPTYATVNNLVEPRMRATTGAILLLGRPFQYSRQLHHS